MKKYLVAAAALAIAGGAYLALDSGSTPDVQAKAPAEGDPMVAVSLPDSLSSNAQMGQRAFDAVCTDCHGASGSGKLGFGPPLIHKIYEPSHHGDLSFLAAVQNGVRAHHWKFGDMPPVEGLTPSDVINIVAYVREIQRANGIQ